MPTTGTVVLDGTPLLIQPGTYVRSKSPLHRPTPKLGEPIDTGPYSTWRQGTFRGGIGQEKWSDPEMYFSGTADTRFGWAQCKFRLARASSPVGGDDRDKLLVVRPVGLNLPTYLYTAGIGHNRLYKRENLVDSNQLIWEPSGVTFSAMGRSFTGGMFALHIGLNQGRIFTIPSGVDIPPGTPGGDTTIGDGSEPITYIDSLGNRGDLAAAGRALYKHVNGVWTHAASVDMRIKDGETWNQRHYFIGSDGVASTKLYQTDTLTTQELHHWENGFVGLGITLHYGTLYVLGYGFNEEFSRRVGQLWAFNGASVRLIYEVPDEVWSQFAATDWQFHKAYSYRRWLVWGYPQRGIYAYDPETDAVHPMADLAGVAHDNGDRITAITSFGGRLVAANRNELHAHWEQPAREYVESFLVSSEYDAGLPGVEKLWVRARVRLKEPLPTGTSLTLFLTSDPIEAENLPPHPSWKSLATLTAGTQDGIFDITDVLQVGAFKSNILRFALQLNPSAYDGLVSNETPRVAGIEVDFLPVDPPKRGWSFNVIAGDDLRAPDGSDYTLNAVQVKAAMDALYDASGTDVFDFIDINNQTFKVRLTGLTELAAFPDVNNPDGDHALFSVQIGEV